MIITKTKYVLSGTLLVLAALYSESSAQFFGDPLEVYESTTENGFVPGARAAGMGGAQIAAGNDGSVLWYNPALLTRIRMAEYSATLSHQRFANRTHLANGYMPDVSVNNTRLGSVWAIFPLAAYQGGVTVGISINRVKSFDRVFRYASDPVWLDDPISREGWGGGEDESGGLWAWSLGGAIEISPKASAGLSLDLYDGSDDWLFFFDSTSLADSYRYSYSHNIVDSFTGISGKIGLTYNITNEFNFSSVIGLPALITVDQTSGISEEDNLGFSARYSNTASYKYRLPFWIGIGAMWRYTDLTLTGDIKYMDYTQMEYRSGLLELNRLNQGVKRFYNNIVTFRVGAEYFIRNMNLKLRAGYYQDPIPFQGYPIETEPRFFTFGAGLLVDRSVNIDLAYLTGLWERDDPSIRSSERYNADRLMITVSFRM